MRAKHETSLGSTVSSKRLDKLAADPPKIGIRLLLELERDTSAAAAIKLGTHTLYSAELDTADAHGNLERKRRDVRVGDRRYSRAALFGRSMREHGAEAL